MSTQTPAINDATQAANSPYGNSQYLRVRVGELEFVINTEHVSGVYMVSSQYALTDHDTVATIDGEFPVFSLGEVVKEKLNIDPSQGDCQALIAVKHGSETSMRTFIRCQRSRSTAKMLLWFGPS